MKILMLSRRPNYHLSRHGFEVKTCEKIFCYDPEIAMHMVKKEKPDYIFVDKRFDLDTVKAIVDYGCPMAYFYGDYRHKLSKGVLAFLSMARVAMLTWYRKDIYDKYNAYFVPESVNTNVWCPLEGIKEKFDVVFTGGTFWKKGIRPKIMSRVNKDFKLLVVGSGWTGRQEFINSVEKSSPSDSNYHLNRGKVNIGAFGVGNFSKLTYYTSNRLYRGMATGKPHIGIRTPKLAECFRPEDMYLEYSTYGELRSIIKSLLRDDDLRKKVGIAQRKAILRQNTWSYIWNKREQLMRENL